MFLATFYALGFVILCVPYTWFVEARKLPNVLETAGALSLLCYLYPFLSTEEDFSFTKIMMGIFTIVVAMTISTFLGLLKAQGTNTRYSGLTARQKRLLRRH